MGNPSNLADEGSQERLPDEGKVGRGRVCKAEQSDPWLPGG